MKGLGDGLVRRPSAADDAQQDKIVRGKSAAQALNESLNDAPNALKHGSQASTALLGTEPHDLSKLIKGLAKVTTALSTNEEQLKDLITNFNAFFAIFAAEEANVTRSVELLAPTIEHAYSSLKSLNAALPQLAGFARDIVPGVEETQPTIAAVTPWIAQAKLLFARNQLGGLLNSLRPAINSFAIATNASFDLFEQTNLTSRCFNEIILPSGDVVLDEGAAVVRRAQLQGVLVHGRRARRRVAGLRGQRDLHPHRDGRRQRAGQDRQALEPAAEPRRPLRQRARPAEGQPSQATVEAAGVQAQRGLLQEREAQPQRPRVEGRPARPGARDPRG